MIPVTVSSLGRDAIARSWRLWTGVGLAVSITWALVATQLVSPSAGIASALVGAYLIGPMVSLPSMLLGPFRYLPITSRDVWMTAWVISTIGTALLMAVTRGLGMAIGWAFGFTQPPVFDAMAFVALCAFVYAGALLPSGPFIGYATSAAGDQWGDAPGWMWSGVGALTLIVFMGGLIAPWPLMPHLPASFLDLTSRSWMVLALGVCASLLSMLWTPRRFGGATFAGRDTRSATSVTDKLPSRGPEHLTGIARLLIPTTVVTFVLLVSGAVLAAIAVNWLWPDEGLYKSFADIGLLPLSAAAAGGSVFLGNAMWVPYFALAGNGLWTRNARHLKALPLSALENTVLVVTTQLLLWGIVWVVLVGIHLAVLGLWPTTLKLDVWLYLAGLSSLTEAALRSSRVPNRPFAPKAMAIFGVLGLIEIAGVSIGLEAQFWMHIITGICALALAVYFVHRSVTHSTSSAGIYQSATASF